MNLPSRKLVSNQSSNLILRNTQKIINKESLGICIGASTIASVHVSVDDKGGLIIKSVSRKVSNGNTKLTLRETLALFKIPIAAVVTGRSFRNRLDLTSISESEATEAALELYIHNHNSFASLASLGAENFVVYELNKEGKIKKLISKNQCASGTGEFFMQQIGRMNLDVDDSIRISMDAAPFKVSGRCSVFCKSDCTHALNKGIPTAEVTAGLSLMIAEKAEDLLKKAHKGRHILVGGVTQNTTVINFLKSKFSNLYIPEEAAYFEALGAAVFGLYNNVTQYDPSNDVFLDVKALSTFHEPLMKFRDKVIFHEKEQSHIVAQECILGLDIGSTTTKGVLMNVDDNQVIASEYIYTHGNPVNASKQVYQSLAAQVPYPIKITGLGVTGSGRHITALHTGSRSIINEISAHARASVFFDPEVDTIFEIGGQDAKYTYINNGVPADYAMNEACSAGTGSFIEEAAWESLKVSLYDVEAAAFRSEKPLNFRDQCAALIGSDIKSALQENNTHEDVLAGLVYSICLNYINRVVGKRPIGKKIIMQGGVCYNKAIPVAMAAITGKTIVVPPDPGLMGAFGTALKVKDNIEKKITEKQSFDLQNLINKEFTVGKAFICNDKLNGCDRKCEINTFKIEGRSIAFGGACNKYYDAINPTVKDWLKNDYVSQRMEKAFQKEVEDMPAGSKTIGINQTFTINRLYSLYHTFFTTLGFRVIMSDKIDQAGFDKQHSSFCYPAELAHGLFSDLVTKNPDYIFMPEIYEMLVPGCEDDAKDSSATCVFISKEINYLSQAFNYPESRIIHPYLNFAKGYASQEKTFIRIAKDLGISDKSSVIRSFRKAVEVQLRIDKEILEIGKKALQDISPASSDPVIVIVGRDYNAFSNFANKGIPRKFASLGYKVVPYDALDDIQEEIVSYQSWEAGKRILRAAQTIKKNPNLFPVYISNYSCGPDSFLIPIFRSIMGDKPSLTLELDQHTADAGINTRIDAFLDVVHNYLSTKKSVSLNGSPVFKAAKIKNIDSKTVFIDSEGQVLNLDDHRVKIIVPCIGDMAAALFAAGLSSLGYNAIALPEMEPVILETGQKYTSGKECLPIILLAGSLINYLENHNLNGDRLAFLNIGGTSACRVAQYPVFLGDLIKNEKIPNVALFTLINQEGYLGLSKGFLKRSMEAIILNDVLEDVRSGILAKAKDPEKGLVIFYEQFDKLLYAFTHDYKNLLASLKAFSVYLRENVPAARPITESRYIALTGEIFIRHNQFAHKKLNHYFGKRGFILKDAYISEWVQYLDYAWRKGVDRPDFTFTEVISRLIREQYISYMERKIQNILTLSGYLKPHRTRVTEIIKHSLHVLPLESTGEPALTLGTALSQGYEQFCGIINIGPFGCLQTRIGEAVCSPNMNLGSKKKVKDDLGIRYNIPEGLNEDTDIPFLTIECDGRGFPQIIESKLETFLVQVERTAFNIAH
jgi:predicted CoA-substrate-specific enzyme activase